MLWIKFMKTSCEVVFRWIPQNTNDLMTNNIRTIRTPTFWWYPPLPYDYPYYWVILDPKSKEDKVKVTNLKNSPKFLFFNFWNKHYTLHTFSSCLIRCANMKWIRQVLLKIQSGHDSVYRRTDGQGETSIPPFNFVEAEGIIISGNILAPSSSKPLPQPLLIQIVTTRPQWVIQTHCFILSIIYQLYMSLGNE